MTVTKNTIIAEILNNDPTQGCVPIFLSLFWLATCAPARWKRPA